MAWRWRASTTTRWILYGSLLLLPYLVLLLAGTLWLHDRGWLVWWLVANALIMFLLWLLARSRPATNARQPGEPAEQVQPDARWTPAGELAWREVVLISTRAASDDWPLGDFEKLAEIVREILETVARQFHPRARHPAWEIPVPYVLRIVELAAADLRVAFSTHVPGAHVLTLQDFQRMRQLADLSQQLYVFYRILRVSMNPAAAILGEAREAVGDHLARQSTAEIKRWAIQFAVQKLGYYAIQLYSGQVILSDVEFETFQSQRSRQDEELVRGRDAAVGAEPLRVIVLGQVKAGKSSLINALFGETRAAVDVVPRTEHVEPYVLERDGIQRAVILDTAGFATAKSPKNAFSAHQKEVLNCDLILIVCSALSAGRAPDRKLLDELRTYFQQEPNRIPPPVLVAVTHIDQLRPWNEWQPPYDLQNPTNAKSRNIADAVEAVAADLQVPIQHVVPVCLAEGKYYNVEDGLVPAILHSLSAAQRTKYQRCLRQFYDEEFWRRLMQQAVNSGRLLTEYLFAKKKEPAQPAE